MFHRKDKERKKECKKLKYRESLAVDKHVFQA